MAMIKFLFSFLVLFLGLTISASLFSNEEVEKNMDIITGTKIGANGQMAMEPTLSDPSNSSRLEDGEGLQKEILIEKDGSVMMLIPAGDFWMGLKGGATHHDSKLHKVYLNAFYIDKCEVTNEQYSRFLKETGHREPLYWTDSRFNKPRLPVIGVTWYDAVAYARWAGKRLPTEAEWEKAARGGLEAKRFPWGDELDKEYANFYTSITSEVATYKPNNFGLYDMAGNVWEWTSDWYDKDYYRKSPLINPTGPESGRYRVIKGGAFTTGAATLECGHRYYYPPQASFYFIGFRCVKDIE